MLESPFAHLKAHRKLDTDVAENLIARHRDQDDQEDNQKDSAVNGSSVQTSHASPLASHQAQQHQPASSTTPGGPADVAPSPATLSAVGHNNRSSNNVPRKKLVAIARSYDDDDDDLDAIQVNLSADPSPAAQPSSSGMHGGERDDSQPPAATVSATATGNSPLAVQHTQQQQNDQTTDKRTAAPQEQQQPIVKKSGTGQPRSNAKVDAFFAGKRK